MGSKMHLFVLFLAFLQTEVTDCLTRSYTLTTKYSYSFFNLRPEKDTPFGGSLPVKANIGNIVSTPRQMILSVH